MKNGNIFSRLIHFLKEPNFFFICLSFFITLLGIAGSITCIVLIPTQVISYVVYSVSVVSLIYSIYLAVKFSQKLPEMFDEQVQKRKITRNMAEDYNYRTMVFTFIGVLFDIAYIVFSVVMAVLAQSVWYGSLAVYHFLLSLLRGILLILERKAKKRSADDKNAYYVTQIKNYRLCGIALLVLEVAMVVPVTLMVLQQQPTRYTTLTAIVFATYTTYRVVLAIVNSVRAKNKYDPHVQSLRNISLANAAVSLLSLQTALLATFSAETESMAGVNAGTGFLVCAFVIAMGIYMIVKATKKLNGIRSLKSDEESGSE